MKTFCSLLLITLTAASCLKSEKEKPVIKEPWPAYDYAAYWKATEIRNETKKWQTITGSIYLGFGSDDPYNADVRRGPYYLNRYNHADSIVASILQVGIHGHFLQKDSLITFRYKSEKEKTVKYKIYGDSILLIRDTTVTPEIQIRYKRTEL